MAPPIPPVAPVTIDTAPSRFTFCPAGRRLSEVRRPSSVLPGSRRRSGCAYVHDVDVQTLGGPRIVLGQHRTGSVCEPECARGVMALTELEEL